jgi:mucin-22
MQKAVGLEATQAGRKGWRMRSGICGLLLLPVALAGLLGISSCGGGGGAVQVTTVTISPASVTVQINEPAEFTAQVALSNTTSTSTTTTIVTWYVNGVAGGNSSIGTIGTSTLDALVGVYTAPVVVPNTNSGQVNITATTPQVPGSTTNVNLITSNTAIATIGIGAGLSVSPPTGTVPAGGGLQFAAILNNVATTQGITWTVSSTEGGNIGTISPTGLYTAPPSPPPGATVTITANDGTTTATATATILFSNASLAGPFTFSYSGNDAAGFVAVAGSFQADGQGHIVTGVEDIDSFSTGVTKQVPITGTYVVGPDGRTSVKINAGSGSGVGQGTPQTWQLAMANFQHGELTRFDAGNSGSGTVDQQNLNGLTTALTTLSGPYVFKVAGADAEFFPQGMAGKFSANGAGSIAGGSPILDVNNSSNPAGGVSREDRSLAGTYTMDAAFPGSGRGTLTLTSTTTGPIQYAFYIVNTTASEQSTQLHLVEIDTNDYLAGDAYAAPTGSSFNSASLASGNYPFTVGGTSPTGAYAAGGVFISSGSGGTSGVQDSNNAGTVTTDTTLGTCTYTVDPTSGRIDLLLSTASGTCAAAPSSTTQEYAMYQTAQDSAVMLELDATAVATGTAFVQAAAPSALGGSDSFGIAGQGIFHNETALYQQNLSGQVTWNGLVAVSGNIDINNFNAVFLTDPIFTTGTKLVTPDATSGRGTGTIQGMNPNVTYNVAYYVINGDTALLLDTDTTRVLIGTINSQF